LVAASLNITSEILKPTKANAAITDSCGVTYTENNLVVTPSHGKVFYIDTGITPALNSAYIGYNVSNTSATAKSGYWVKIGNFLGGKLALNNIDDQYFKLPDLPAAKTISNKALSSNVATLTTSATHGYSVGDSVTVYGVDSTFNGTYSISAVPSSTTFSFYKTASNVTSTAVSSGVRSVSLVKTAYFYLKATSATTTAQTHDIEVFDSKPDKSGSSAQLTCRYSFTKIQETIKAAANKVEDIGDTTATAITLSDSTPELGQVITLTVEGATGQVGNGSAPDYDMIWLTPAAIAEWPTRALRLESVSTTVDKDGKWSWDGGGSTNDQSTYTNQLFIPDASGITGAQSEYKTIYTFRVIGRPTASVSAIPISQISSGTQVKHADTTGAGSTATLSFTSFNTNYTLNKTVVNVASPSTTTIGGNAYVAVRYQLTATSTSSTETAVDEFVDTPSSSAVFNTNFDVKLNDIYNTTSGGVTIEDPITLASESGLSPPPLHFPGPFYLKSGTTAQITYEMWIPQSAGTYSNTAYISVGDLKVGASASAIPKVNVTTNGTTTVSVATTTESLVVEAQTLPATSIANTGATLNATVDPNNQGGTAQFEYGTSATLGTSTTVTATTPSSGTLTGGDPISASVAISGLTAGTKYYFRIKVGSVYGDILSFTTTQPAGTPTITTDNPTLVTSSDATLNGTIDPNLTSSFVSFTIGTTSDLSGSPTTVRLTNDPSIAYNNTSNPYTEFLSADPNQVSIKMTDFGMPSIVANTTYYYKANYTNSSGSVIASGVIKSFKMVNYLDQTITFADLSSKTYGDEAITTSPTATSTLTVALASNTTDVCTVSGFVITIVGTGTCEITANQAGGFVSGTGNYYNPAPEVVKSFVVSPKPLTVTGSNHSINYGDVVPSPTATYSSFAYSENASNLLTQPTCTTNYVRGDGAGTSRTTTCSGAASNNYTFTYVSGAVTINKKTVRVTASSHSVTYGDSAPTVTAAYNSADFYDSQTSSVIDTPPTCTTQYVDGDPAGTPKSTSCSGAVDNNYDFSYTPGSVSISQAALTITASSPAAINRGDAVPTITPSYSGFVNTDTSSVVSGVVCSTTYTTLSAAGTYPTSCSSASASNYSFTYVNGSLVANNPGLTNQTITFGPISGITYGSAAPTVSPTASSNLAVTLTSNSPTICTVSASSPWTITILKPGTCSITASQAGNESFNPASDVTQTFEVGVKTLTVDTSKVSANNKVYNDSSTATLTIASNALSGIVGSDVVTLGIGSISASFSDPNVANGISVTTTGSFALTGTNATYYALTQPTLSLTANITQASLTITASSHSVNTGASAPTITASYAGFEGNDADQVNTHLSGLVCTTTYTSSSNAGTYPTSCSGASSQNYILSYVAGSITAAIQNQTITFGSISGITYGGSAPTVSPTASSGLAVTLTSNSPSVCTVDTNSPWTITILTSGTCSITASQAGNGSYNAASSVTQTFNIATKTLTVVTSEISANNKVYDGNTSAEITIGTSPLSGIVNSENVTLISTGTTATFNNSTVGNGKSVTVTGSFTLGGTKASNYTLTQPSLSLTANITPAALTITASSHSVNVGAAIPTITGSYSGLKGSDTSTVVTGLVCTTTYLTTSSAGSYLTSCTSGSATNYEIYYLTGAVTASSVTTTTSGGTTARTPTPTPTPTPSPTTNNRRNQTPPPVVRRLPVVPNPNPLPTSPSSILATPFPQPTSSINPFPLPQPTVNINTPNPVPTANNRSGLIAVNPNSINSPIELSPGKNIDTIDGGNGQLIVSAKDVGVESNKTKEVVQEVAGNNLLTTTSRSISQLANEKLNGFKQGQGLTVEIIGARSTAQFVVAPGTNADPIAVAAAIKESTARTATSFAKVESAVAVAAPNLDKPLVAAAPTVDMLQRFSESNLLNPKTVDQLNIPANSKWISVSAVTETYKPGSKIYLAVTTQPIIFGEATVDKFGNAKITGKLPISALESGAHTIRVVGIRTMDNVGIDNQGEVFLSDETLSEIKNFDRGTKSTVKVSGYNASGGNHLAIREVPLILIMPWWTIWIVGWTLFIAIVAKVTRKISTKGEKLFATVFMLASALPALVLGWINFAYPVMGVGLVLALIGVACIWFLPSFNSGRNGQNQRVKSEKKSSRVDFWSRLAPGM